MARSSGGRPVRSSHPSWPPLRVRALVNGLIAALAGAGLLWLTWGALDFTVYDASGVPAPVRIIALWLAAGMPIAWLAIGLHLIAAGLRSGDRVLLAHGSAEWEPAAHDDVLRGIRIRRWRLGLLGGRRISARTLGWLPELSPYALAPLAGGILVLLVLIAWMARGYGAGVIALIAAILWLGWRLLRGWQSWTDVRDHRARPRPEEADATPDEGWAEDPDRDDGPWGGQGSWDEAPQRRRSHDLDSTAVMPRYEEPRRERPRRDRSGIAAERRIDDDAAGSSAARPLFVDDDERRGAHDPGPQTERLEILAAPDPQPLRRGRRPARPSGDRDARAQLAPDDGPPEVLVDRSVQRAIRAKQARRGDGQTAAEPPRGRASRGRGRQRSAAPEAPARETAARETEEEQPRAQGLRAYLGQRTQQGQEDSGTRALRASGGQSAQRRSAARGPRPAPRARRRDEPFDQEQSARRGGGAPTAADAMDEIYGRDDHAPSLLSYLSRRRDDDRA